MIVSLYIAVSEDGFIADDNGSVSWLDSINQDIKSCDGYGYEEFYNSIDSIVIGRKTYEQILGFSEFPYKKKHIYVVTSHPLTSSNKKVTFVENILDFLSQSKTHNTKKVWLLGGAELASSFYDLDLIDEYIITIVPKLLGSGIALHPDILNVLTKTKNVIKYHNGVTQYYYHKKNILIKQFDPSYTKAVIDFTLKIQVDECSLAISLDDQQDLVDIQKFFQKGNGNFWIALDNDNNIIGTLGLIDMGNSQVALRKMFVAQEERGKGKDNIALMLLRTASFWCKERHIKEIFLGSVEQKLAAAERFYEKHNFIEISKEQLPKTFPLMPVHNKFYMHEIL